MTGTARRVDAIQVTRRDHEGWSVLETDCRDYDAFVALPRVVEFDNRVWGLTGWNSDTARACYQPDRQIAWARP